MHVCIHTYIHTYIHVNVFMHICDTCTNKPTYIHTYVHTYIQVKGHGIRRPYMRCRLYHTYVYTYIHTYIHTYRSRVMAYGGQISGLLFSPDLSLQVHTFVWLYICITSRQVIYIHTYIHACMHIPQVHVVNKQCLSKSRTTRHTHSKQTYF